MNRHEQQNLTFMDTHVHEPVHE